MTSSETSPVAMLTYLAGGATVFGALLYWVGRIYMESYYNAVGIPPSSLSFTFADYVYYGVSSWAFLIIAALTALILIIWKYYICDRSELKPENPYAGKGKGEILSDILDNKKSPKFLMLVFYVWLALSAILLIISLFFTTGNTMSVMMIGQSVIIALILILTLWMAYCIIDDPPTWQFLRFARPLYWSFMIVTLVVMLLSFQWLPKSLGAFIGLYDSSGQRAQDIFPSVQVVSSQQIEAGNSSFIRGDDGLFYSEKPMLLLLTTPNDVFLRGLANRNPFSVSLGSIVQIEYVSLQGKAK